MPVPVVEQPKHTKFVRILKNEDGFITFRSYYLTVDKAYRVLDEFPIEIINDQGDSWLLNVEHKGIYWDWVTLAPLIGV